MRNVPKGQWSGYKNILDILLTAAGSVQLPFNEETRTLLGLILKNIQTLQVVQELPLERLTKQSAAYTAISQSLNAERKLLSPEKIHGFITAAAQANPVNVQSLGISAHNLTQIPGGRWNQDYTTALNALLEAAVRIEFPLTPENKTAVLGILKNISAILDTHQDQPTLSEASRKHHLQLQTSFDTDPLVLRYHLEKAKNVAPPDSKKLSKVALNLRTVPAGSWNEDFSAILNSVLAAALDVEITEQTALYIAAILRTVRHACAEHALSSEQFPDFETLQDKFDASPVKRDYVLRRPLITGDGVDIDAVQDVTRTLSEIRLEGWKPDYTTALENVLEAIDKLPTSLDDAPNPEFFFILRDLGKICDTQQWPLVKLLRNQEKAENARTLSTALGNNFATMPAIPLNIMQLAHARMELPMAPQQETAWLTEVTQRMQSPPEEETLRFDAQGLSTNLYALSQQGILPPSEFLQAWYKQATAKIDEFSSQDLSLSLYALGSLGVNPPADFMQACQGALLKTSTEMGSRYAAISLYGLACLKACDAEGIDPGTVTALKPRQQEALSPSGKHQCFLAAQVFPELGEFTLLDAPDSSKSSHSASQLAKALRAAVQEKFPPGLVEEEQILPCIHSPVDMVAILPGNDLSRTAERRLWVQFDGPTHFNRDSEGRPHLNGSSRLQSYIAKKNGIPFQRVPYFEVQDLKTGECIPEKLAAAADKLAKDLTSQGKDKGHKR